MLITFIIVLMLTQHVLAQEDDFFLMRNQGDDNRRTYDETMFDKKFQMVHENYSRVVSSALKHNVAVNSDCGGLLKNTQHIIQSPGYPNNYPDNLVCEFTFMSPFVCRNQFHVQFIDFDVEPSRNCSKDYVRVGGVDVLCGQVIGIKKYDTVAGVLKVKMVTDGWGSRKGFQMLVTRLPCQNEENGSEEVSTTVFPIYTGDEELGLNTVKPLTVNILPVQPPKTSNRQDIPPPDWDFPPTGPVMPPPVLPLPPNMKPNCLHTLLQCCFPWLLPQFPQFPGYNPNFPPPNGNYPIYPVPPIGSFPSYPQNPNYNPNTPQVPPYLPPSKPWSPIEFINVTDPQEKQQIFPGYPPFAPPQPQFPFPGTPRLTQCCRNVFNQRRFYLTSPAFPIPNRRPTDCLYIIERAAPNTCRLKIEFKFFNHGNEFDCLNDLIEIDGNRICGCKTGLIYTSQWGMGPKVIRYRNSGYDQGTFKGFILDITQEPCPYRYETPLKRIDTLQPVNFLANTKEMGKTVVRTNSTTVATYYQVSDENQDSKSNQLLKSNLVDDKNQQTGVKEPEVEKARFYYSTPGGFNEARCNLTPLELFVLKKSALFVQQPICYRF